MVTSPYNSLLALARLREHADCVLPIDNGALIDICGAIEARSARAAVRKGSSASGVDGGAPEHAGRGGKPWDGMNGIAASVLLNMTSGARFEGALNVDLNEITMNLVPFPRMHFLLSSLAPLVAPADVAKLAATPRTIDQLFTDAFCASPPPPPPRRRGAAPSALSAACDVAGAAVRERGAPRCAGLRQRARRSC